MKPGGEEVFSYHVILKYEGKTLVDHTHSFNNLPPIEVEAVLDKPVYSGNTGFPLVKNFKMTYRCTLTTTESSDDHKVDGKITGEVEAKIHGCCSRKKAKELAFEEAQKQITSYLHKLHE